MYAFSSITGSAGNSIQMNIIKIFSQNVWKNNLIINTILKIRFFSMLSLSKNSLGLLFVLYQAQEMVKAKFWWEYLIIWIGLPFLKIQQVIMTFQELSLMLTLGWHHFDFLFIKTFLIIETSLLFHFLTIMMFFIWWTFILILLNQLWSI